ENSIAGSLHDASVVDGDCRIDQVASQGTQPCQRAVLVRSGQPAESDDVRREDRSKLSRLSHVRASGSGRNTSAREVLNLTSRAGLISRVETSAPSRSCRRRTPPAAWPLGLAGIGADLVAVAGQLGEALSGLVGRHRSVVDLTADRP